VCGVNKETLLLFVCRVFIFMVCSWGVSIAFSLFMDSKLMVGACNVKDGLVTSQIM